MLLNCGVGEESRIPWTARRSNQSILKKISPGCSLEGLMLKLKLQYFGHLMWRADSFKKTIMLGKIEGRRRGWQRMRWLDGITDSHGHEFGWTLGFGDGQGGLACCGPWGHKESNTAEWLNWTDSNAWPRYRALEFVTHFYRLSDSIFQELWELQCSQVHELWRHENLDSNLGLITS